MNLPTAGRNCIRFDTLFATVLLVMFATSGARAQVWTETGDAGDLLSTAQSTLGTGALTAINGNLGSSTDVDLYCIRMTSVPPAGLPLLQLQCTVTNGPNVWLFDEIGRAHV